MNHKLLIYDKRQFYLLKRSMEKEGKQIQSISSVLYNTQYNSLNERIYDVSSMIALVKTNDTVQYQLEQIIMGFQDDMMFIVEDTYHDEAEYCLRYCISDVEICNLEYDQEDEDDTRNKDSEKKIKRIIDIPDDEVNHFIQDFSKRLYGHLKFKEDFKKLVASFRIFNRIGEHKVLSLFLMGDSGVGKTEVARAIHKAFKSKRKLAKINFGNYSSHDALNSLIGSPLGYIGSDGGELIQKIQESDVGLVLIDEFEKADAAVFNYFLDVLESGKVTNSRAEEYDVNGFIIVFTSNISKESFVQRVSPELRSRFDYVGVFNLLTNEDKKKFVRYRLSEIIKKYEKEVGITIPDRIHSELASKIKVEKFTNMRHLNKKIKDVFVEYVENMDW